MYPFCYKSFSIIVFNAKSRASYNKNRLISLDRKADQACPAQLRRAGLSIWWTMSKMPKYYDGIVSKTKQAFLDVALRSPIVKVSSHNTLI